MRGGRSTYGVCVGALSWGIEQGHSGTVDVSGLAVGIVFQYSDDEPGSPWTYVLYLDSEAEADVMRRARSRNPAQVAGFSEPLMWQAKWCIDWS